MDMRRRNRNRKRSSKAANPTKIAGNTVKLASPSGISSDAEQLASSPTIASETEKPAGPAVALAGADRRIHPRYEFVAAVEVRVAESDARIETRVRDLSQQGCYVDTDNPLRVSGQNGVGLPFEEETHTRAISAHGGLIQVSTQVNRGQRLTLSNVQTKAALECVVAHIDRHQGGHPQVGVEFMLPNPVFWHVAFPPKDWTPRHPDAKS